MIQKEKKDLRVIVRLTKIDLKALVYCINVARETNMSGYIRQLIHDKRDYITSMQ